MGRGWRRNSRVLHRWNEALSIKEARHPEVTASKAAIQCHRSPGHISGPHRFHKSKRANFNEGSGVTPTYNEGGSDCPNLSSNIVNHLLNWSSPCHKVVSVLFTRCGNRKTAEREAVLHDVRSQAEIKRRETAIVDQSTESAHIPSTSAWTPKRMWVCKPVLCIVIMWDLWITSDIPQAGS